MSDLRKQMDETVESDGILCAKCGWGGGIALSDGVWSWPCPSCGHMNESTAHRTRRTQELENLLEHVAGLLGVGKVMPEPWNEAKQAVLDFVGQALLSTKDVKIVMPPVQQWELDLKALMKTQYEMGMRDGRASSGDRFTPELTSCPICSCVRCGELRRKHRERGGI